MRSFFIAATLLFVPSKVLAEPLTFEAALQRALQTAPSLQGAEAGVDARRSAAIAAGRLPDPSLQVGLENFPVSGPPAFSLNRESMTMARVGVEQAFPNPAKRLAERSRAEADIISAESELALERQNVRLETALAWIDLYYAERKLEQLHVLDGSLRDLQSTVTARLASGSSRPALALEPDQLRAAVNDRRSELAADVARTTARLTRFTGIADAEVEGEPPVLAVERTPLEARLATLPKLRSLDAAIGTAEADSLMARAAKRPDWRVSADVVEKVGLALMVRV